MHKGLSLIHQHHTQLGVVVYVCDPNTQKMEAKGFTVQGRAQLCDEVELRVNGEKRLAGIDIYFLGCSEMTHSVWFLGLDVTNEARKVGSRFWKAGEWKGKNLLESMFSGKVPG